MSGMGEVGTCTITISFKNIILTKLELIKEPLSKYFINVFLFFCSNSEFFLVPGQYNEMNAFIMQWCQVTTLIKLSRQIENFKKLVLR